MAVAIDNFLQLNALNKVMVFDDMFELGAESFQEHKAIVELLSNEKNIFSFFIGKEFYDNRIDKKGFHFYATFESFSNHLQESKIENSYLLIKGSRGIPLQRTLDFL